MRRGFKKWAETVAEDQRRLLGLQPEAALPAQVLAEQLGATVVDLNGVPRISAEIKHQLLAIDPDSWSATTIVHNGCIVIIHNTAHSPRRQESNLMHELAHVLCKHHPSHMIQSEKLPFALRTYDKEQEEEAGWLGGCLQLPRPALIWALQQGMTEQAILDHFSASQDLLRYRRRMTGVDIQLKRRTSYNR